MNEQAVLPTCSEERRQLEPKHIILLIWLIHERALSPADLSEERRQLEAELAFWSKFASAKEAHVLFFVPL